jgi:hypothetical protein
VSAGTEGEHHHHKLAEFSVADEVACSAADFFDGEDANACDSDEVNDNDEPVNPVNAEHSEHIISFPANMVMRDVLLCFRRSINPILSCDYKYSAMQ